MNTATRRLTERVDPTLTTFAGLGGIVLVPLVVVNPYLLVLLGQLSRLDDP